MLQMSKLFWCMWRTIGVNVNMLAHNIESLI